MLERRLVISSFQECEGILDLGCGEGVYVPYLLERASEVVGLDFSVGRLKKTKEKKIDVVLADASHLPFRDNSFDIIWASELIEHTPSLGVFGKLERVARKMVAVTVPNPKGPYYRRDPTHILRYDIYTLQANLSQRPWRYKIHGLGLCLPYRVFPNPLRRLLLQLTWNRPSLAFNLLITGEPQNDEAEGSLLMRRPPGKLET